MQTKRNIPKLNLNKTSAYVAVMFVCLFIGLVFGCVFVANSSHITLAKFLNLEPGSISNISSNTYSFSKSYFTMAKYPIIVFLLGFTAFGQFLIPIVVFTKGFMLSFSISTLITLAGRAGVFIALSMFGLQSLVSIPCILIISALSLEVSKTFTVLLTRQKPQIPRKQRPLAQVVATFSLILVLILLTALADVFITPTLVSLATSKFLI